MAHVPATSASAGALQTINANQVARRTLEKLREVIEAHYENIPAFHRYAKSIGVKFEKDNLYKCLPNSDGNPPEKKMSLKLFVRLCGLLNIGGERMREMQISNGNITLEDFLQIDSLMIFQAVAMLPHQDYYTPTAKPAAPAKS